MQEIRNGFLMVLFIHMPKMSTRCFMPYLGSNAEIHGFTNVKEFNTLQLSVGVKNK